MVGQDHNRSCNTRWTTNAGTNSPELSKWETFSGIDLKQGFGAAMKVVEAVNTKRLQGCADRRTLLQGLDGGRAEEIMDMLMNQVQSPKERARLHTIQADIVYMHMRARV